MPLMELFRLVVDTLVFGLIGWLFDPAMMYFPIMFVLVFAIVLRQYSRQAQMEEHLFGAPFSQPLQQAMVSLGFGLLGGFLASIIMIFVGLGLSLETGILYVWPVVLLLLLIRPRFMCFAYGGGVVGLLSLLLRLLVRVFPGLAGLPLVTDLVAVDLPGLMALVALLHLTEGFLIFVSGHLNASPVVVEGPQGRVVGGFMLQRFWLLPMAALLVYSASPELVGDTIGMPGWWPLLKPALDPGPGMILLLSPFPIVAALGYSDIAIARSPREKSRYSARNLLVYSVVLLLLALLAARWQFMVLVPVLFAPLGHEYLIHIGNKQEWSLPPRLRQPQQGVMLLTTLPGSPARDKGLDSGWVILAVNGFAVNSRQELTVALSSFPGLAELDVLAPDGSIRQVTLHQRQGRMGLVPLPDGDQRGNFLKIQGKGVLARWWEKRR